MRDTPSSAFMRRQLSHLALALTLVVSGCGGDDEPSPVATSQPPIGAPAATATPSPSPTASPTPTPSPSPSPTPTPVEEQPGGAGDEEAPRIPVELTVDGEGITPPRVSVPAFFPLDITVRNDLPRDIVLRLGDVEIRASAGGRGRGRHPGLRKGEHEIAGDGVPGATIVAGAEPGP
jgi:hypothetical protein